VRTQRDPGKNRKIVDRLSSIVKIMRRFTVILLLLSSLAFVPGTVSQTPDTDQSVMATLWYQKSGELRALCYQAYNLAEMRVNEYLSHPDSGAQPAVIFDIDETLLDNSPSEALNIIEGKPYTSDRWKAWTDRASARALPGAVDFCRFLARNDVELIYLSNRSNTEILTTMKNLQDLNFPYADRNHLYMKAETSDKESRRNIIEKKYNVILLVGDNLADFDEIFENRSVNLGFHAVDSLREEFGKKFIILPNPMYGGWTKPLYGSQKGFSSQELADLRRGLLRTE